MGTITAGRPTDYGDHIVERTKEYIAHFQNGGVDSRINPIEVIPSMAGLSIFLGVARSTLYEWGKKYPIFSDTLNELQGTQEVLLLSNGLSGKFTAPIAKLALANHGYTDKVEQKIETKEVKSFSDMYGQPES